MTDEGDIHDTERSRDSPLPGAPPAFEKAITPLLISTYGATSGAVNAIASVDGYGVLQLVSGAHRNLEASATHVIYSLIDAKNQPFAEQPATSFSEPRQSTNTGRRLSSETGALDGPGYFQQRESHSPVSGSYCIKPPRITAFRRP